MFSGRYSTQQYESYKGSNYLMVLVLVSVIVSQYTIKFRRYLGWHRMYQPKRMSLNIYEAAFRCHFDLLLHLNITFDNAIRRVTYYVIVWDFNKLVTFHRKKLWRPLITNRGSSDSTDFVTYGQDELCRYNPLVTSII